MATDGVIYDVKTDTSTNKYSDEEVEAALRTVMAFVIRRNANSSEKQEDDESGRSEYSIPFWESTSTKKFCG